MNIDEKISHIQSVAMKQARKEGNDIITDYRQALENIYQKHIDEMQAQSEQRIKSETTAARLRLNAALSKGALTLKRELSSVQRKIKRDLFSDLKKELESFMKTEEYDRLLQKYIIKAADYAEQKEIRIILNSKDAGKKDMLEQKTGLKLEVSEDDFIGGIRAIIPERNILIDYSFQNSIEREYENYTFGGMTNA